MQLTINEFNSSITKINSNLYKKIGEYEMHSRELKEAVSRKEKCEYDITIIKKTSAFLASVSKELRSRLVSEIEKLVTMAITKVLNDDTLSFKLDFETTATTTNARCKLFDKVTNEEYDIIDSFGGGLSDIVCTALRLISIELWTPKNDLPIFLDETGKYISSDYQRNFGLFLKEWSRQFNRQIILISHSKDVVLDADKRIVITKKADKSIISY